MAREANSWDSTALNVAGSSNLANVGSLFVKRCVDLFVGGVMLIVTAPIFLAIILAIRAESSGRAVFRQPRVGLGGRTFGLLKFRTMIDGAEELRDDLLYLNETNGILFKMRNDPRITRVGRILRRFSLDELPQLINVLQGEMSLVGPRPIAVEDYDFDRPGMRSRLMVKPGLTGLWQVSGRSELTEEEMVELDHAYLERSNLFLDVRILLLTISAVLNGRGAY